MEATLAGKLKENGYVTAHIGKWHMGDLVHFPEARGFDVSVAASQRGAPPTFFYPYKGFAFGEFRFVAQLGSNPEGRCFTDRKGESLTDRLTDEALKISEDAGSHPFFLNLCYYCVHTPVEAREQDIEHFKNKLSPGLHHQNVTYAGMVKTVDNNVGRILENAGIPGRRAFGIIRFVNRFG
jgi:arylsulfatase A-like enzyme